MSFKQSVRSLTCVSAFILIMYLTLWDTKKAATIKELIGVATSKPFSNMSVRKEGLKVGNEWCRPLKFLPIVRSRPTTALVSFPGSGNTWFRYLIQQASGVLTGSQYFDKHLWKNGFPGERVKDRRVAVIKTHEWGPKIRSQFQRAVLLMRNPGPAILAEFNRQGSSDNHTGLAPPHLFLKDNGTFWETYVDTHLRDWKLTNLDWLRNFTDPLHVVQYEALSEAVGPTLRDTLNFLDLPIDEESLQCATVRSEGFHKRPSRHDRFDPYTSNMKQKLQLVQELVFQEVRKKL